MFTSTTVELYADGACKGNPGPGGWACVLRHKKAQRRLSGFDPQTTNNRMELLAVISGLHILERSCSVHVISDSQYVCKAFTEGWLKRWQSKGWSSQSGDPIKNKDLWILMFNLQKKHILTFEWVRGHSGHYWNELCDSLANEAILRKGGIDERIPED